MPRSYPLRSYACGTCGGSHPTERCPTTNPLEWCGICRKMTNHKTKTCYYQPRVELEEKIGQATTFKRPKPVLGTQSPLPGTTGVCMAKVGEYETQIVPSIPYGEEGYYTDGVYEEEITQSLMTMGLGRGRAQDSYARRNPGQNGACYRCAGDHFIRDCPIEFSKKGNREPPWPRVLRYCGGCGIDHLSRDCPSKLKEMGTQGKATLHYVELVEELEENETIPLRVVTRAQAQQQEQQPKKEGIKKKPRRRTRRKASGKVASLENSQLGDHRSEAKRIHKESLERNSKTSSRGSILLEKVNENLESLLKAFEGRISKETILPKNL